MTATAFDTLKFARRLKDSGVDDTQAEAQATAIQEAFAEALETRLATKGDIQTIQSSISELEATTQSSISELEATTQSSISELKAATQSSISELKAATQSSISELKAATQASISELKTKLEARITLIQWMLGIVIAAQVLPLLRSIGIV